MRAPRFLRASPGRALAPPLAVRASVPVPMVTVLLLAVGAAGRRPAVLCGGERPDLVPLDPVPLVALVCGVGVHVARGPRNGQAAAAVERHSEHVWRARAYEAVLDARERILIAGA